MTEISISLDTGHFTAYPAAISLPLIGLSANGVLDSRPILRLAFLMQVVWGQLTIDN